MPAGCLLLHNCVTLLTHGRMVPLLWLPAAAAWPVAHPVSTRSVGPTTQDITHTLLYFKAALPVWHNL